MRDSLLLAARLSVLLSLFCVCGVTATAAVLDDFERDQAGIPSSPAVAISLVDAPEGSPRPGKALAIDWTLPHAPWIEFAYKQPVAMPDVAVDHQVAIQADVWVPASPGIVQVGVRLLDAHFEVFQWSTAIAPSPTAGWRQLVIPIDLEKPNAHWGGDNDGRIGFPLKLLGYAAVFASDKTPAGRMLIDQVQTKLLPAAVLETDRFPSLVNATGDSKCDLVISNPEDRPLEVKMKGTLTDFFGQTSEVAGSTTLPARDQARMPLALGDRKPGIRWLAYTLQFDGSETSGKTTFVIADPVERAGGPENFLFGICSHTETATAIDQDLEMQAGAAAGATVMRVGVPWATLEPAPGQWKWEQQDRLIELAAKYGMETQPILGYGPAHAVSADLRAAQAAAYQRGDSNAWSITLFGPPEDAPWRRYVAAMVGRYQGRIRLYEVWNEPDLAFWRGTTDEYLQLLRSAYEEVHRADPKALLLTGGFATVLEHQGRAKNPDLQERVLAEASDSFDIHAFHQHGTFKEFKDAVEGELQRLRARMTQPRPLYFNETAISSSYIGEKTQATTLVKKMAYAMAQNAIGYTWYDLRNDGTNPTDMEHNYGLLTDRFRPKAAYAAYSETVRRLHGMRHLSDLDLGSERQAHVFGSARSRVMVWWNEGRGAPELPVFLRCGNGAVRVIDIMGVARELPQVDGVVLAQPSAEPQYLEMPAGADSPTVAGTLVKLEIPSEAAAGQPLNTTAELTNPLSHDIAVRLSWRNAVDKDATVSVSVPAGGKSRVPLVAMAPAAGALVHELRLDFAVDGTPWSGTVHYAMPVVRVLGDATPANRDADWVLEKAADVVNFTEADPALAAFNWKGPNDLSAQIWAWREGGAMRVRVDVRDDIHMQKEKAPMLWRGDSVQLALRLPDTKGYWEIGAAQDNAGNILKGVWSTPTGFTGDENSFTANCEAIPAGLRYELTLPCDAFGLTDKVMEQGFGFNLVVNDNDGTMREGLIRIAPGLGESKDPRAFPLVHFSAPTVR